MRRAALEMGVAGMIGGDHAGSIAVIDGDKIAVDVVESVVRRAWELYRGEGDFSDGAGSGGAGPSFHFRGWWAIPIALLHPLWKPWWSPFRIVRHFMGRYALWASRRRVRSRSR